MLSLTIGCEKHILSVDVSWKSGSLPSLALTNRLDVGAMPSYLCFSRNRPLALAVVEGGDSLVSLAFDEKNHPHLLSRVSCPGGPAYVSLDKSERWALSASYGSGESRIYPLSHSFHLEGSAGTLNTGTYSHCAVVAPDGDTVYVASKGTDRLSLFSLKERKLLETAGISCPAGSGPRHLVFAPDGQHAYLMCENDCTLISYAYQDGRLRLLSVEQTLPRSKEAEDSGADVHVSKDSRFVYVSNRGHNSLSIFRASKPGPELVAHEKLPGKTPRNFCLLPESRLIVANQDSSSLSLFDRDESSGELHFLVSLDLPERPFWVGCPSSH